MKLYFSQYYGKAASEELTGYVTELANDISAKSSRFGFYHYCSSAERILRELTRQQNKSLADYEPSFRNTVVYNVYGSCPKG